MSTSLDDLLLWDRRALERHVARIDERRARNQPFEREQARLEHDLAAARQRAAARRASMPALRYPEELPVVGRREEIATAIRAHQVVVVAGETGSGKTTQLPKILLECGLGLRGQIAHTQPRRIAARTVAARVAEELGVPLGAAVGFKIRFTDKSARETLLKVMTDGILLAELREDPDLLRYEAVIIDEAHERSLNIDFLLGYLQRLVPRRPDLKLVITSATIDPQRFAAYFGGGTPVIEVSGRTYPVETRYRALGADADDAFDPGLTAGILSALDEIDAERGEIGRGDVLVFLPGEREIREAAEAIEQARGGRSDALGLDVLPLYSRLSWADQQRVFQRGGRRRVVLATNVAETSITVPGIRSVIDSGLARISHYSPRAKIQRLPIEPVSRASADQRRGRCGRVGPGLCIRLYGEDDYDLREPFTPPEVLRTNLASVILQMESLGLGSPADFPFLDPPETRLVNDGYRLLQELEAVDDERRVTPVGRQMARLPVDPRIARMLVEAHRQGALAEMLVLASALSIQDPRERPQDKQQAADEKHAAFADPKSDLATLLNLWGEYQRQRAALTRNALRRWCAAQFLSAARMREWEDLLAQLGDVVEDLEWRVADQPANHEQLHRSALAGLLGSIGEKTERGDFIGPRGLRFAIAPGTPLRNRPPRWVMAATLVETQRVYARLVAAVEPAWIEFAARHLVKREYGEPEWDADRGIVTARETVTLYGLTLAAGRRVNYGTVAPREAREIFVREALVHGRSRLRAGFLDRNRAVKASLAREEAALRRHVVLVDEPDEAAFYLARLPDAVHSLAAFERWRKDTPSVESQLTMTEADLRRPAAPRVDRGLYPERLALGGNRLPVEYRFEPQAPDDGATVTVPEPLVPKLAAGDVDWGVPGWLDEKLTGLIRGLPKPIRRHLVPAPDVAAQCAAALAEVRSQPFLPAVAACLTRIAGQPIPVEALAAVDLPPHLRLNLRVLDAGGRVVGEGRDVRELQRGVRQAPAVRSAPGEQWDRAEVRAWDFGLLPETVRVSRQGVDLELHPALVDRGTHAQLTLYADAPRAEGETRRGVLRLLALALEPQLRTAQKLLASDRDLMLLHQPVGSAREFARDVAERALERACLPAGAPVPRAPSAFEAARERGRPELVVAAERLGARLREALAEHQRVAGEIRALPGGLDAELVDDVRAQLGRLVHAGFVRQTPDPWLDSLARFIKAVGRRAGKLRGMRGVVADAQWDLHAAWRRHSSLLAAAAAAQRGAVPEVEQLRWLLDEYAVQLFAQDLKTSVPVSAKRIAQALAAAEAAVRA